MRLGQIGGEVAYAKKVVPNISMMSWPMSPFVCDIGMNHSLADLGYVDVTRDVLPAFRKGRHFELDNTSDNRRSFRWFRGR